MMLSPFLASIALQLKHEFTDKVPTAGTDGTTILYNPEFLKELTLDECIGLVAHEVWHVALMHCIRNKDKDKRIYNFAGDYVINYLLVTAKFSLPDGALYDRKYADWSTEQVYEDLLQDPSKLPEDDVLLDVMDGSSLTPEQTSALEAKITDVVLKAKIQTEMGQEGGNIPAEIQRLLDDLIAPKLNWRELLEKYVDSYIKADFSWKKPNKRFFPQFYLPSQYSETLNHITVAVDTSGSIRDDQFKAFMTEVKQIYTLYSPETMTIIDCDNRIHGIHDVTPDTDLMDIKFKGHGGTSFKPVLEHCKKNEPNLLIYFTDLYAEYIDKSYELNFPIIWICHSNHKPQGYGDTVYLEDVA